MFKLVIAVAFFILGIYFYTTTTPFALAQTSPCQTAPTGEETFADGLISAGGAISGKVDNSTGTCVVDSTARFATYELPKNYEELKNLYYSRAKLNSETERPAPLPNPPGNVTQSAISGLTSKNQIYNFTGDLTISGGITGNKIGIIFIEGDLLFSSNLTYNSPSGGLVFVVKNNVYIASNVQTIDAVLISFGNICTNAAIPVSDKRCNPIPTSAPFNQKFTNNGSFISLNKDKQILFRRSLLDNREAAELIIQQPKYLVLLKDIFSQTLEIRTEY